MLEFKDETNIGNWNEDGEMRISLCDFGVSQ